MSGVAKKPKKRRTTKEPKKKEPVPEVVTRVFGDSTYKGIIREDHFGAQYLETGVAEYTWHNGICYEGPFVASDIVGKGKIRWPDGSHYEGELRDGKRHGDGIFHSADGATSYRGQWYCGNRHGHGYLAFDALQSSYYEGCWLNGKKHGEGCQVWPRGNKYAGQWILGKMHGRGTMTWITANGTEQYTGLWEDSRPHGEGSHTWFVTDPSQDPGTGAAQQQQQQQQKQRQLNNRYSGQWNLGKREGVGTFYYANGAYYRGEWKAHTREGHGRHTFEDGRAFEGSFVNGTFADPRAAAAVTSISDVEDNPMSRCTDISDLEVHALPSDFARLEATAGFGYTEPTKILKEVYNKILWNVAELKDMYGKYRALLPLPDEDPFVLRTHQLWLLARNSGLVTPRCSLARLDRFAFAGPRRLREDTPEASQVVRPLTPRFVESIDASGKGVTTFATAEAADGGDGAGSGDDSADGQSAVVPCLAAALVHEQTEGSVSTRSGAEESTTCANAALSMIQTIADGSSSPEVGTHQQSGNKDHFDVHSPTTSMLLRHFLEATVRLAIARFPDERGLASQVHRLFDEHLLREELSAASATSDTSDRAQHLWDFLVHPKFHLARVEFEPALRSLFEGCAAAINNASKAQSGKPAKGLLLAPCCGGYSGPRREMASALARSDKTLRLKDVLRLLDRLGFLLPTTEGAACLDNPLSQALRLSEALVGDEDALSADCLTDRTATEESGGQEPMNVESVPTAAAKALPTPSVDSGIATAAPVGDVGTSTAVADNGRGLPQKAGALPGLALEMPSASELTPCTFGVTLLQLLRLTTEVMSPETIDLLQWDIDSQTFKTGNELVSLLEYVETELVFAEFHRLLLRLAELGTCSDAALCEKLPLHSRFRGFLRHVFFPAFEVPYSGPVCPESALSELTKQQEGGETRLVEEEPHPFDEVLSKGNVAHELPVPLQLVAWHGFAPETLEVPGRRYWPASYVDEVLEWR